MKKQKIEINYCTDVRTGSRRLQIFDENENVLAILDIHDFNKMRAMGLDHGVNKDIVKYANEYKGAGIGEFEASVTY